ncbi:MAG: hypothetical protein MJZ46_01560 [Bacteroidales bacterium]|nr:hypothetical protein [Bacteroidales bacterium]MCQ2270669.1 hypothetical protein [Bacteroidales bacterium]
MKKSLCVLAAVAMVAICLTSCNKKCTCTVSEKGFSANFTYDLNQVKQIWGSYAGDLKKCSDMNYEEKLTNYSIKCK